MLPSFTDPPAKNWLIDPLRFPAPQETPMLALVPTFTGLENVARHLRNAFNEIGTVVVERVLDRNHNARVAAIDLSPEALRAFLPVADADPTSALPGGVTEPLAGKDEQREALLAWLRWTFAANMRGEPNAKFKVGLWRPKREALVGSVRVDVSGVTPVPVPDARVFVLPVPGGEPIVTSDPDLVEAHARMLALGARGLATFAGQAATTLQLLSDVAETNRRTAEILARVEAVCGPPGRDADRL